METHALNRPRPCIAAAARAVAALGGAVSAAKLLGVPTYQRVQGWALNGVPVAYAAVVEAQAGGVVTRRELYPHDWRQIWPELADSEPKHPAALANQAQGAINTEAKEAAHA